MSADSKYMKEQITHVKEFSNIVEKKEIQEKSESFMGTVRYQKIFMFLLKQFNWLTLDLRLNVYPGVLYGKKIWLRPTFPNDHLSLQDCFMDPDNMKYFQSGKVWSKEKIEATLKTCAFLNLVRPKVSSWSIISHDGMAGCFWAAPQKQIKTLSTLGNNDLDTKKDKEKDEIEIGYNLRPTFSGKGITTEAGEVVLNSMLPYFKGKVFATAHPNNIASQRVLQKIGLEPDPCNQNVAMPEYDSVRNYYHLFIDDDSDRVSPK